MKKIITTFVVVALGVITMNVMGQTKVTPKTKIVSSSFVLCTDALENYTGESLTAQDSKTKEFTSFKSEYLATMKSVKTDFRVKTGTLNDVIEWVKKNNLPIPSGLPVGNDPTAYSGYRFKSKFIASADKSSISLSKKSWIPAVDFRWGKGLQLKKIGTEYVAQLTLENGNKITISTVNEQLSQIQALKRGVKLLKDFDTQKAISKVQGFDGVVIPMVTLNNYNPDYDLSLRSISGKEVKILETQTFILNEEGVESSVGTFAVMWGASQYTPKFIEFRPQNLMIVISKEGVVEQVVHLGSDFQKYCVDNRKESDD